MFGFFLLIFLLKSNICSRIVQHRASPLKAPQWTFYFWYVNKADIWHRHPHKFKSGQLDYSLWPWSTFPSIYFTTTVLQYDNWLSVFSGERTCIGWWILCAVCFFNGGHVLSTLHKSCTEVLAPVCAVWLTKVALHPNRGRPVLENFTFWNKLLNLHKITRKIWMWVARHNHALFVFFIKTSPEPEKSTWANRASGELYYGWHKFGRAQAEFFTKAVSTRLRSSLPQATPLRPKSNIHLRSDLE